MAEKYWLLFLKAGMMLAECAIILYIFSHVACWIGQHMYMN
jgi:hypothetical protein